MAGLEFGAYPGNEAFSNQNPGAINNDYFTNSEESFRYFTSRGITLFRIPFRWERIQRSVMFALDGNEVARLRQQLDLIRSCGGTAILDLHNYGKYREAGPTGIRSRRVSGAELGDLWARLVGEFGSHPAVEAYGVMNEPSEMNGTWKDVSRDAVNAIRQAEQDYRTANNIKPENYPSKVILVAGDDFSSAHRWIKVNGPENWIADGNVVYEAHCYFDASNEGQYVQTYEQELAYDRRLEQRGPDRLAPFAKWCRDNQVRGLIGEYGIPNNDSRWLPVLDRFLEALDAEGMTSCYWAAGEKWGDYILSIQPRKSVPHDVLPLTHLVKSIRK